MTAIARILGSVLAISSALASSPAASAKSAPFDLLGPSLHVAVTHDGMTLPVQWVPNLSEGDRITIRLNRDADQDTRYRLIAGFLRGVTERPRKEWFHDAKSWKDDKGELSLIVPKGARQMVVFVMPEDGGDVNAVIDIVRKQPGTFVRATQELNQASLDRARLDAFLRELRAVEKRNPAGIASASKALTRSLSIRLDTTCLQQPVDLQAACLADNREAMLLSDSHTSQLASTLVGAPTDLALQLSATRQGGYGQYSAYIGVVRDVLRLFGAFQSSQLQYIPALMPMGDSDGKMLLNAPLSFGKPTSVMVAAMPAIEAPTPPPLRLIEPEKALCAAPDLIVPVEGAPLVYATHYAHNLALRMKAEDGSPVDIPVAADARAGGFKVQSALPFDRFGPMVTGQLVGEWGFAPFTGPNVALANPAGRNWTAGENAALVIGRDNEVTLRGGAAPCVTSVGMRTASGGIQPVKWTAHGADSLSLTLPLENGAAGDVVLMIGNKAGEAVQRVTLPALEEAARIDSISLHAGDDHAFLTGTRLDQVRNVTVAGMRFEPGQLTRVGKGDRMILNRVGDAPEDAPAAGQRVTAEVSLTAERRMQVAAIIAPPRPRVSLINLSATNAQAEQGAALALSPPEMVPQNARLTFAFRAQGGAALTGDESVEIATMDGSATTRIEAGKGYDLQDAHTAILSFNPLDSLGAVARGPLHFRLIGKDGASDWVPLATLVRVPEVGSVTCTEKQGCVLSGKRLFLIAQIAGNAAFENAVSVPDGFTADRIELPGPPPEAIFLKLRDDPNAVARIASGKGGPAPAK